LGLFLDRTYIPSLACDLRSRAGRKVFFGLFAAAALYAVFFAGNILSRRLLPFAGTGIDGVYLFKSSASTARVVLLMTLIIGPGEEVFWRGFLQRRWQERFGAGRGFLFAAALYAGVHAGSGNAMLVLAAAVCGLFWGELYRRTGSVLLIAVSHTAWDLAAFVLFPFAG
jgi:membrane protease YdiL (CAAX protease family)